MRISCVCFARIRDDRGRYCLLLNKGRLKYNHERVLSPIGGGLEFEPTGRAYLEGLGATDFEGGNDLRFRIADDRVDLVADWFARRVQRELWVMRELREELVDEVGALVADDLIGATESLVNSARYYDETKRSTAVERRTAYLGEVFEVRLPAHTLLKLRAAAQEPIDNRWVYFASKDEIVAGKTTDGVSIGRISYYVVEGATPGQFPAPQG